MCPLNRYHTVVEAENRDQLEKEQRLRDKQKKRDEKTVLVKEEKAAKVRTKLAANDAKIAHSRKILKDIKQDHESKCANFLGHVLETEVRIREFRASQEGRNFEKSEKWRAKVGTTSRIQTTPAPPPSPRMRLRGCRIRGEGGGAGVACLLSTGRHPSWYVRYVSATCLENREITGTTDPRGERSY